jgi:hypothetical protein
LEKTLFDDTLWAKSSRPLSKFRTSTRHMVVVEEVDHIVARIEDLRQANAGLAWVEPVTRRAILELRHLALLGDPDSPAAATGADRRCPQVKS